MEEKNINFLPKTLQNRLPNEIGVISVPPKESKKLNNIYRGKDKSTNVLSFRYDDEYGEVVLCPFVIRKEAKGQGNTFDYQMTWMVVHGIIHLAGLHHEVSEAAEQRVDRLETQIINKFLDQVKIQKVKVKISRQK